MYESMVLGTRYLVAVGHLLLDTGRLGFGSDRPTLDSKHIKQISPNHKTIHNGEH